MKVMTNQQSMALQSQMTQALFECWSRPIGDAMARQDRALIGDILETLVNATACTFQSIAMSATNGHPRATHVALEVMQTDLRVKIEAVGEQIRLGMIEKGEISKWVNGQPVPFDFRDHLSPQQDGA